MIFHVAPEFRKTNQNPLNIIDIQIIQFPWVRVQENQWALSIIRNCEAPLSLHSYGSNKSYHDFLWTNWSQPKHTVWRINESNRGNGLDSLGLYSYDPRMPPSCTQVKASNVYIPRPWGRSFTDFVKPIGLSKIAPHFVNAMLEGTEDTEY